MKKYLYLLLSFIFLIGCSKHKQADSYRVSKKNSGNFSIIAPEIQPQERIVITINNEIIWDAKGNDSLGYPGSWRYYNYPKKIKKILFIDYYKGVKKFSKEFKDTLVEIPQRTLIITRPFSKLTTTVNSQKSGFVSIDTGTRSITLVNDAVQFKGMWTDEVH
ncbi:MAG: hypothetical protein AAGC65_24555 [Mucilaginibacter sp.]|uniref:hypothetical protein n=1 Tax=Mucilaginibacter sp. TaxID=1882438 RepID=UPI0031AAC3E0